jgi:hypothetical protein
MIEELNKEKSNKDIMIEELKKEKSRIDRLMTIEKTKNTSIAVEYTRLVSNLEQLMTTVSKKRKIYSNTFENITVN